jgi:hypothetical protein
VRFKLSTYPQQHVIHALGGLGFCSELLAATTTSGRKVGLLHVDVVEMKITFVGDHACLDSPSSREFPVGYATPLKIDSTVIPHSLSSHSGT